MDRLDRPAKNECGNCGNHVQWSFARVYGDQDDQLHECPDCAESMSELKRGSGTGREPNPRGTVVR